MKIRRIIILLLFTSLLSGCYDYIEPNDLSYVVAIGIDKGSDEGLYNFTLQFARPTQISGGSSEEGGSGEKTIGTVKVEAPSIHSAVNVSNHVISKTFTLSHTKIIVISKEIAKSGIKKLIDTLGRSSDLRPTVFLCVSDDEAGKYLESVKPVVEINPVKYYRLIFESPNSSYIPKNDVGSVFQDYNSKTKQISLPLVGVGKGSKENENKSQSPTPSANDDKKIPINNTGFEYHMKKYTAGNLDIEKQNESEVLGAAVFKDDKMISKLLGIESEILNLISGKYTNGYSTLYVPQSPDNPVTIRIEQLKKPKITINTDNNPKINISLFLEGIFMSVPSDYLVENNLSEFEKNTSEYIEKYAKSFLYKTSKELNSDIVGFSKNAKFLFLENDDFTNYNWNEKYKDAEFKVNVQFSVRRTGLTMRSSKE